MNFEEILKLLVAALVGSLGSMLIFVFGQYNKINDIKNDVKNIKAQVKVNYDALQEHLKAPYHAATNIDLHTIALRLGTMENKLDAHISQPPACGFHPEQAGALVAIKTEMKDMLSRMDRFEAYTDSRINRLEDKGIE